jgi:hypothetical protein
MLTTQTILIFAWSWIAIGLCFGAMIGIKFAKVDWLGGYDSWERRLIRLGHIAFLGTSLLNIAFVFTVERFELPALPQVAAWGFLSGAIAMPTCCYLAAFYKPLRHLFFIPVIGLVTGAIGTLVAICAALPKPE